MARVFLTKKHSAYLIRFIGLFYDGAVKRKLKAQYLLPLFLVKTKLDQKESLVQDDWDLIHFLFDTYFSVMDEIDIDPVAEQTYAKIVGHFPNEVAYYDKLLNYDHVVGFKRPMKQTPLGF